ncbi:MAG: beta-ketoacyl synthase N-terminal-like domain-containing protein, partial [Planctomycetota bacterium]
MSNEERMQRALHVIERLQERLEHSEARYQQPIAVIGMSCRFPAAAESPEAYWKLLYNGEDAVDRVPTDRWDAEALYDPNPDHVGKIINRDGGFIRQSPRSFDAAFFGIAPKEATAMDPQQRLLLEVTWEALERAFVIPEQWNGKPVGVFIGISGDDYSRYLCRSSTPDAYVATGNSHSVAAGRLSYVLGFRGPSFIVDTACSSSLVALHAACQSLRLGESEAAIVGGVNSLLTPDLSIAFSKARMLSPTGRCKTFSAEADGFVRSEGCGVVILKRLDDAVTNGDPILAVIRGSAVNQDGRSGGLTVPNGPAQQSVIRSALKNARVSPSQIRYIEAHGTGTELGDPIELGALADVFGESHSQARPLLIGSAKTNLGHMEAAAGMGGLLKVILAMQHGRLPRHLHFDSPSPHVPWSDWPLQVVAADREWSKEPETFAGVSSFGFSGTNAHVVLQNWIGTNHHHQDVINESSKTAASTTDATAINDSNIALRLLLSAKTDASLRELARSYISHFEAGANWLDTCWTAFHCRMRFCEKITVYAKSTEQAVHQLREFATTGGVTSSVDAAKASMSKGESMDWDGPQGRRIPIPTYAFDRREHWRRSHILEPTSDASGHPMVLKARNYA